jgi:hypothetical protein
MEINDTFGLLTVIAIKDSKSVLCKCQCGAEVEALRKRLLEAQKTHCGNIECRRNLRKMRLEHRGKWKRNWH